MPCEAEVMGRTGCIIRVMVGVVYGRKCDSNWKTLVRVVIIIKFNFPRGVTMEFNLHSHRNPNLGIT